MLQNRDSDSGTVGQDRERSRLRRHRLFLTGFTLLLVSPWIVYAWMVVRTAKEMRVRLTLERNQSIAQLSARLLDEQQDRLHLAESWLREARLGQGGAVYVLNGGDRIVLTAGASRYRARQFRGFPALERARRRQSGHMQTPAPDGGGIVLTGYAQAERAGWTVLVMQPENDVLAPTNYLVRRLSLLVIPLFGLMLLTAWTLSNLFRRQEQLAQQLAAQNEHLRAADRAKSDFLANVSHDLRTPLASVQVSISGLLDPEVRWQPEQAREQLQMASEELDQLTARVRNLLDMARIEANEASLSRQPCDLTDIVGSALERLQPLLQGRPIQADFPPEPLLIEGDQAQLETAAINLLENALKYSPEGTPLAIEGARAGGRAVCRIRDQGPGVRPGDEERVFEKFYRAHMGGSPGGTGLGLAICKAVIEAHGGEIGARNVPGGGAEFWFALPLLTD